MLRIFHPGRCTGRLLSYDVTSGRIRVIKDGICFANGVQLSRDERTLVVAETLARRVNYYNTTTWELEHCLYLPCENWFVVLRTFARSVLFA